MPPSPARLHGFATLCLATLAACSSDPSPVSNDAAASPDVADAAAPDVATPDLATPDLAAPDAAPDAAPACVDIAGAWEWTASCTDPRFGATPDCFVQTGCAISGINSGGRLRTETLVGNTLTYTVTQATDGIDGRFVATFMGERATATLTVTAPFTVSCTLAGRRATFPGATRYCCDVGRNDCGAGQRCNPVGVGSSGSFLTTACVPDGTRARGAVCMRTMPLVGADTCSAGNFCANFDNASPAVRTCQRLCSETSQCAAGESCGRITALPSAGVCRRRCTLLGTDCMSGSSCRPVLTASTREGRAQMEPLCLFVGAGTDGMSCTDSFGCAADHACFFNAEGGACRRVCDATHACGAGMRCEDPFAGDTRITNPSGFGACVPMM